MADIDIGPLAITRAATWSAGDTVICKDNPANTSGQITSVELYAVVSLEGCIAGILYTTNGNTLKCRSSVAIGDVASGSKQTFSGLSLAVETGDYIGCYFCNGVIVFRVMVGGLRECNIGGRKYELWYIYID